MFLIRLLHQTTTFWLVWSASACCSLYVCYIKPQLKTIPIQGGQGCSLYVCYIKPQLDDPGPSLRRGCSLYVCYIKPQLAGFMDAGLQGCSLYVCYIKPQLYLRIKSNDGVVPYTFATSNHNYSICITALQLVVPYTFATSNHNCVLDL